MSSKFIVEGLCYSYTSAETWIYQVQNNRYIFMKWLIAKSLHFNKYIYYVVYPKRFRGFYRYQHEILNVVRNKHSQLVHSFRWKYGEKTYLKNVDRVQKDPPGHKQSLSKNNVFN